MRCTKRRRQGVFSGLRYTRETAAAAPVVIRDRSARVDLSRLLLSCANVPPPDWAPPYHARSLSQCSNRYVVSYLWLDLLLSSVRLSIVACLPLRSQHRMLHYRTGSPRPLPTILTGIRPVSACTTLRACFISCAACMSFTHCLVRSLSPPCSLRPSPAPPASYLLHPLSRSVVSLL